MNIVFVSHYPGKGGANNEMILLIKQLLQRGNNITVVAPCEGWLTEQLKDHCEIIVASYHRWVDAKGLPAYKKIPGRIMKWCINWHAAMIIARRLKGKQIDLIHTNDSITIVGAYISYLLHVPHVWHMREIFDGQFGLVHTFSENYCKKWMSRAEAIVAISKAVYDRYRHYNLSNIKLIYDGIEYRPIKKEIKKDPVFTMLFCGGTSKHKGFDDVEDLARKLIGGGTADFIIKVAASSDLTDQLVRRLKTEEIYSNFRFLGFVDNLDEIRHSCDVMLMCSKDEAFGLVTVESMLAGLPVIGRNSGATSEIIENGKTGFLYDTVDELFNKVRNAMNRDLTGIKRRAFKYAKEHFLIDRTADQIENLYIQVTSHHKIKGDERNAYYNGC